VTVPDAMPAGTTSGTPQVLLAHHLKQLKLPTVLREYDKVARECARDGVDHPRYLLRLIELELIDRERRTVERRIRAARFPATKSFDTFDFAAIPGLNKMLVLELARCEYILRRENIIALGNSGTGKTHVALALGLAACQKGFTVAFTTAAALVSQLLEARDERRLLKLQRDLASVKLLIIDELGYVPLSPTGAELPPPKPGQTKTSPPPSTPKRAKSPKPDPPTPRPICKKAPDRGPFCKQPRRATSGLLLHRHAGLKSDRR
jgi:hypothetical protein